MCSKSNSRITIGGLLPAFAVVVAVTAQAADFSWQEPHARVLAYGDLDWAPHTFSYSPGASVIYIDYEGGDDNNAGTSPSSALKHHPWDANATGNARSISGVKTYVFKRGVIYRGKLVADESGQDGSPIILTSDPSWGSGEAGIYGSERISGGWTRADASSAPHIPDPTSVWYIDLPFAVVDNPYGSYPTWDEIYPQMIAEVTDTGLARIRVARSPNWQITDPNYPTKDWWDVLWVGPRTCKLPVTFSVTDNTVWSRGTIWTGWGIGSGGGANMGTINHGKIKSYSGGNMIPEDKLAMDLGCKYFIENMPFLLDEPNEFYCTPANGSPASRLFVRLSGDRDPNTTAIEVGVRPDIIDIVDKSNIVISGLTLAMNNQPRPSAYTPEPPHWNTRDGSCQAIELSGVCANITISNCKFRHVVMGIAPRRDENSPPQKFDNVHVLDNDIAHVNDQAIVLGARDDGYMRNVSVMRNRLINIGERQICRSYSSIQAINVQPATSVEIAGNIVHYAWGVGINYRSAAGTTGKPGDQVRVLLHHNKVTFSLLGTNDWGGIEAWEDGPGYIFCNISGNPRGYRPFSGENVYNPWGGAIYVDHGNNQKVFNNIVWGVHNDPNDASKRNPSGLMQAVSERSFFANNTIYNFYRGNAAVRGNRGLYVGNLYSDISLFFESDANTLAHVGYAKNVYCGSPENFANGGPSTLSGFVDLLTNGSAWCSQTGMMSSGNVLVNPANGDFRPAGDALGNGARIFIPWNLADVVGEWGFQKNEGSITTVFGTDATTREDSDNDLTMHGVQESSYIMGALEDWTQGAVRFDGTSTHGTVASASAFDIAGGGLILEAYIRTSDSGPIMSKGGTSGYALSVDQTGAAVFTLKSYTLRSQATINDGEWHHVVAELDRGSGQAAVYVDGAASNGAASGSLPSSLTNSAAFYVGRDGSSYFKGDIDFARVARGSFADGATSFEELYAWEFEGPAARDFAGALAAGPRDAGALNYSEVAALPSGAKALAKAMVNVRHLNGGRRLMVHLGGKLDAGTPVHMTVVTPAGRVVFDSRVTVGDLGKAQTATIDARRWASGVYVLRVSTPDVSHVSAMSLHK